MKNQYGTEKPRFTVIEYIKEDFKGEEHLEIVCEHCGKHLCMAVEWDLESSWFVCDECYKKVITE